MSAGTISDVSKWVNNSDLDYFAAFVRAYIPLNTWMNYNFNQDGDMNDSEMIEATQTQSSAFKDKVTDMIVNNAEFKQKMGFLHISLIDHPVLNKGSKILLNIILNSNPCTVSDDNDSSYSYKVEYQANYLDKLNFQAEVNNVFSVGIPEATVTSRTLQKRIAKIPVRTETVKTTITPSAAGSTPIVITQNKYDITNLENNTSISFITNSRWKKLKKCYENVRPFIEYDLVESGRSSIDLGVVKYKYDIENIYRSLIDTMYKLRCSLFHGTVTPDSDENLTYKAAYDVLNMMVKKLV